MNNISIILPAFKEDENLKYILPQIIATLKDKGLTFEILVVDTMEPMDDTESVCRMYGEEGNLVRYVRRKNGNMYSDAVRTGFKEAKNDYIVMMDADGSHNPKDLSRLYDSVVNGDYDLVIGSRYAIGGYTDNNWILKFMSRVLNYTYKIFFHLKVRDVSNSFRIYKSNKINNIKLECDNFDIVEEILIKMSQDKNLKVKEIPINFKKRKFGESKRNLLKFTVSYIRTMIKLNSLK